MNYTPQEVLAELQDPAFEGRIHGTRNAAALGGCHGPMCRKYHRDKARRRRARMTGKSIPKESYHESLLTALIQAHARRVLAERVDEQVTRIPVAS